MNNWIELSLLSVGICCKTASCAQSSYEFYYEHVFRRVEPHFDTLIYFYFFSINDVNTFPICEKKDMTKNLMLITLWIISQAQNILTYWHAETKQNAMLVVVKYLIEQTVTCNTVECVTGEHTLHRYNRPLSHKSSCEPVLNVKTQSKAAAGARWGADSLSWLTALLFEHFFSPPLFGPRRASEGFQPSGIFPLLRLLWTTALNIYQPSPRRRFMGNKRRTCFIPTSPGDNEQRTCLKWLYSKYFLKLASKARGGNVTLHNNRTFCVQKGTNRLTPRLTWIWAFLMKELLTKSSLL